MSIKKADIKQFLQAIKIQEVMSSPPIILNDTDDFAMVHEKISVHGIRHLPVVNSNGFLVGVITQRDLFRINSPKRLDNGSWHYDKESLNQFLLKSVMVSDPYFLRPSHSLYDAVEVMTRYKYGCIPIVDDEKKPCGMLTRQTIFQFLIA